MLKVALSLTNNHRSLFISLLFALFSVLLSGCDGGTYDVTANLMLDIEKLDAQSVPVSKVDEPDPDIAPAPSVLVPPVESPVSAPVVLPAPAPVALPAPAPVALPAPAPVALPAPAPVVLPAPAPVALPAPAPVVLPAPAPVALPAPAPVAPSAPVSVVPPVVAPPVAAVPSGPVLVPPVVVPPVVAPPVAINPKQDCKHEGRGKCKGKGKNKCPREGQCVCKKNTASHDRHHGCLGGCPDDCPEDDCPRDDCPEDDCPEDDCPENDCPGDGCPEDDCPENDCPRDDCPEDDCPENDCPGYDCPEDDCPENDCPRDDCPEDDCPEDDCGDDCKSQAVFGMDELEASEAIVMPMAVTVADLGLNEDTFLSNPSARVFSDTLYVYTSEDIDTGVLATEKGDHYNMQSYKALQLDKTSRSVMQHEAPLLTLAEVPWASRQLWAVDVIQRDEQFYLFFSARDKQGLFRTGVASSDSPLGPFKSAQTPITDSYSIDPHIFTDQSESRYLIFGGLWAGQLQSWQSGVFDPAATYPAPDAPALSPKVALLSEDMMGFMEAPRDLVILDEDGTPIKQGDTERRFFQGAWLHEEEGQYYLSYSTGDTQRVVYAVSDNPMGPFTYKGVLLERVSGWSMKHSIVKHQDKWLMFYHDSSMSKGQSHLRGLKVLELQHMSDDGSIIVMSSLESVIESNVMPLDDADWQDVRSTDGSIFSSRHESAYVAHGKGLYLMGGRGNRPLEKFNPVEETWESYGTAPAAFHHIQPISYKDSLYVVGGFKGNYPNEEPLDRIYIFNTVTKQWQEGPMIPEARRRGAMGAVLYGSKIYLVAGNTKSQQDGAVPWLDSFDIETGEWSVLSDAPSARDHFSAVIVSEKIYAVAGRQSNQPNPFDRTVATIDVYDFKTAAWSTVESIIPTQRAGALTVAREDHIFVIGGESADSSDAYKEVEIFNTLTQTWKSGPSLLQGRHSGGAAIVNNTLYVISGAGARGGSLELPTQESIRFLE